MISRRLTFILVALGLAACGRRSSSASGGPTPLPSGTPSEQYPAEHPAPPQVLANQHVVLVHPRVIAVTFANDPNRAQIDDFIAKLGGSSYWPAVTAEYGVGAPSAGAVHLTGNAPASVDDRQLPTYLTAQLDGSHSEWPANDPESIFLLFYPAGTTITGDAGTSCSDYGAYHNWTTISGRTTAYAMIPDCGAYGSLSALESLTLLASHEIVEAATDPYDTGYAGLENAGIWTWAEFGSELGDMCQLITGLGVKPADLGYMVQRSWSNAAAAAGHSPCQPYEGVYAAAAPVVQDTGTIDFGGGYTESSSAVKIAVGSTRSIEVDLFSDGDTGGPFSVTADDFATLFGSQPELELTLDRSSGRNGEKIALSIKVLRAGTTVPGGEGFLLSTPGGVWPVYVTN